MPDSTALRLTGRDVLPLLHRTTSNALADLTPGGARVTLFCDFRGRLQHRAVVAVTSDSAVWLLRPDAPGTELAVAVDASVFRDDVRIENRSGEWSVTLARAHVGEHGVLAEDAAVPTAVATGDGTKLLLGAGTGLTEAERIVLLHPRHGHEIVEAFNPFEVGLAHEVHLAKGCFTGQEALQRLITYDSVRRRPVHVRFGVPGWGRVRPGAHRASVPQTAGPEAGDLQIGVPCDVIANGERAGVLTSVAGREGFALLRRDVLESGATLTLADGTTLEIVAAPELARPLGRP